MQTPVRLGNGRFLQKAIMTESAVQKQTRPEDRVRGIVEEVIEGRGLYLVEVNLRGRKGSQVVDVYLDSEGELGVDTLAEVSREVGFLLDAEDVLPGRYNLNVSSPGLDRPLVLPRQFRKHLNRPLLVRYRAGEGAPPQKAEGELARVDDEAIELALSQGETLRIPFGDIEEAKVQLPW